MEYFPALGCFYIQYPSHTPIFRKEGFLKKPAYPVEHNGFPKIMKKETYKK